MAPSPTSHARAGDAATEQPRAERLRKYLLEKEKREGTRTSGIRQPTDRHKALLLRKRKQERLAPTLRNLMEAPSDASVQQSGRRGSQTQSEGTEREEAADAAIAAEMTVTTPASPARNDDSFDERFESELLEEMTWSGNEDDGRDLSLNQLLMREKSSVKSQDQEDPVSDARPREEENNDTASPEQTEEEDEHDMEQPDAAPSPTPSARDKQVKHVSESSTIAISSGAFVQHESVVVTSVAEETVAVRETVVVEEATIVIKSNRDDEKELVASEEETVVEQRKITTQQFEEVAIIEERENVEAVTASGNAIFRPEEQMAEPAVKVMDTAQADHISTTATTTGNQDDRAYDKTKLADEPAQLQEPSKTKRKPTAASRLRVACASVIVASMVGCWAIRRFYPNSVIAQTSDRVLRQLTAFLRSQLHRIQELMRNLVDKVAGNDELHNVATALDLLVKGDQHAWTSIVLSTRDKVLGIARKFAALPKQMENPHEALKSLWGYVNTATRTAIDALSHLWIDAAVQVDPAYVQEKRRELFNPLEEEQQRLNAKIKALLVAQEEWATAEIERMKSRREAFVDATDSIISEARDGIMDSIYEVKEMARMQVLDYAKEVTEEFRIALNKELAELEKLRREEELQTILEEEAAIAAAEIERLAIKEKTERAAREAEITVVEVTISESETNAIETQRLAEEDDAQSRQELSSQNEAEVISEIVTEDDVQLQRDLSSPDLVEVDPASFDETIEVTTITESQINIDVASADAITVNESGVLEASITNPVAESASLEIAPTSPIYLQPALMSIGFVLLGAFFLWKYGSLLTSKTVRSTRQRRKRWRRTVRIEQTEDDYEFFPAEADGDNDHDEEPEPEVVERIDDSHSSGNESDVVMSDQAAASDSDIPLVQQTPAIVRRSRLRAEFSPPTHYE